MAYPARRGEKQATEVSNIIINLLSGVADSKVNKTSRGGLGGVGVGFGDGRPARCLWRYDAPPSLQRVN